MIRLQSEYAKQDVNENQIDILGRIRILYNILYNINMIYYSCMCGDHFYLQLYFSQKTLYEIHTSLLA
jgi:hypothetical protein